MQDMQCFTQNDVIFSDEVKNKLLSFHYSNLYLFHSGSNLESLVCITLLYLAKTLLECCMVRL